MNRYTRLCELRNDPIEGIGPWVWITNDYQAWTGIRKDWVGSHKAAYIEHVTDWSVCVQAGGCMGMHPRLFSEMFGRVYTFEPDPLNFFCLTYNCQKDNIIKFQSALGHENKLISINRPNSQNTGVNTINEEAKGFIPMVTIDSLALDACGLIQLDLEFYELNILRGALETIKKYKPVITCELGSMQYFNENKEKEYAGLNHGGNPEAATLEEDILALLEPFGYKKVGQSVADGIYKVV